MGTHPTKLADILVRYRWLFVVPVVLPLSLAFNLFWALRGFYQRGWSGAPKAHERRVSSIQAEVRDWRAAGTRPPLCTARKPWMSVSPRVARYKGRDNTVQVALYDILALDTERCVVRVEPGVTIGQLTRYLIPKGWSLPIVPELDDLTVGGLLLGYGIEASSHRYGLFADIIEACEVIIGDATLVRATRVQHADLFRALPWSYGALGIVVAVELRIIRCKPWVHVRYLPVYRLNDVCESFTRIVCRDDSPEFVEGIVYGRDRGVIITGDFADGPEDAKVNAIGRWFKPWFYKHCESFLTRGAGDEYIPLRQYYRRHTRSIFWEGELIIPFGNHPVFRYLLGWMMPPKIAFLKLTQGETIRAYYENKHVCQEVLLPIAGIEDSIEFFHGNFECYPLWLCPHRIHRTEPQGLLKPDEGVEDHEMFVDIGAWYVPGSVLRGEPYDSRRAVRAMQDYAIAHRGYQCLYAVTELTREEFRRMFDCRLYDGVRQKYHAQGVFMDAYDKVKRPSAAPGTSPASEGAIVTRSR
jgi:delta24-sterol reductase